MSISRPNTLQLIAVEIKLDTGVVSEMMTNGNVLDYNNVKKANGLRLDDLWSSMLLWVEIANWTRS